MPQRFILTTCEENFSREINHYHSKGYRVLPGSLSIVSIATPIDSKTLRLLDDVDKYFSASLVDSNGSQSFVFRNDADSFRKYINDLVSKNHKFILGSFSAGIIKLDGYNENVSRCYITHYSCVMEN